MSPAPLSLRLTNSPPHGPMVTRRRERRGRRAPSPACLLSIALAAAVVRLADGQGGADSLTTAASEAVGSIDNVGFYFEGPKIFADTMNIPRSWNPDKKPNMIKPRSCDGTEELACEQAYMRCLLQLMERGKHLLAHLIRGALRAPPLRPAWGLLRCGLHHDSVALKIVALIRLLTVLRR